MLLRQSAVAGFLSGLALLGASVSWAAPDEPALSAEQQEHYEVLIHELRCLVCQNQTIADSAAPLAADLRDQVRRRIAAGESKADIRRYVTDRYGDYVLYKPPFNARTALLWAGPFLLLAAALATVFGYTRRSRRALVAAADPEALRRVLDREDAAP